MRIESALQRLVCEAIVDAFAESGGVLTVPFGVVLALFVTFTIFYYLLKTCPKIILPCMAGFGGFLSK